ncbi:hypothetical protein DVH05_019428 [Phytophthora capsici]|nr:hypothetical protein DVH05_028154 [Phytophthora capsici]KAG1695689.1 hypothetical protein DVH05_019428 [Phytophthora capsici]
MGGGNGQKSATKRERNNLKKMKDAKQKNHAESKAKMEADKNGVKCKICMTTFLITASVRPTSLILLPLYSNIDCCVLTEDATQRPLREQTLGQGLHYRAVFPRQGLKRKRFQFR